VPESNSTETSDGNRTGLEPASAAELGARRDVIICTGTAKRTRNVIGHVTGRFAVYVPWHVTIGLHRYLTVGVPRRLQNRLHAIISVHV